MDEIIKIYPLTPPGFMREDSQMGKEPSKGDREHLPIAMAYVPWQSFRDIYEKDKGFMRGTIFEELDKPFKGAKR